MDKDKLIGQYIEANPHRPGLDEARLKEYGVAVWALIGHLPAVGGDIAQVAYNYHVPLEAIEAALAYYERHREIIDARIAANRTEYDDILQSA
jgi:uncharacterized protein (DUF433 family)